MNARLSTVVGVLVALALGLFLWCGREPSARIVPGPPAPEHASAAASRWSLLVTGDTGKYRRFRPWAEYQRSVGRGLAREDRRAPVDGLLLLGDNFYPDGLLRDELVTRIRRNVAGPFCRFAELSGPRSAEVADVCDLSLAERHPIPIYAVLGNHDHKGPESIALQSGTLPEFVSNWTLSDEVAHVVEVTPGVSLVLVDSNGLQKGAPYTEVTEAIARARGPWRLVAMHHPIAVREGEEPGAYHAALRQALAEAPAPVQLVLAGHRHNLQVIQLSQPRPAVQLISGAGSQPKELHEPPFRKRHFAIESAGFARVDLAGEGETEGLRLSLFTLPRSPFYFWRKPRLVSRWWVGRDGRVSQVAAAPKS